ncbi:uncharacterized protein Z518_00547 [Rhinocladiella mackenziei CBS 650.93]|uniref:ABM domain-containing protein n=1 Tax=Rhinocladiella mackenziei CBS 650.93 TaxID=1442369 RepID=A0A0D2G488_9EURO|nr:uncharacterized protein Z518_00547 [Rhinocladiella mackenziei CBS 650.93]KIX09467.1 hypothetical protein Z518_00547 [Rhinocladiella mackenziei CBS 650.93]
MAPATEIVFLPLKEGDKPEDGTTESGQKFAELAQTILAQEGCQFLSFGRQVEHPNICNLFINWDAVDYHTKFIASPEYKPFFEKILSVIDGNPSFYHVHFDPHPPNKALVGTEPMATEIITAYFPLDYSPEDQKTFDDGMKTFASVFEGSANGFIGAFGGWVVEELDIPNTSEKGKVYVALIGWTSVEAHMKCRETQTFKDNVHYLRGAKDLKAINVFHVPSQEVLKA